MENNQNLNSISTEEVTLPPFKDIRKSSIGETYQYFKQLIQGKTIKNLDECIALSELSLFDENLRLTLIDSLHLENEVFKILLSQNECQIKKVLQMKWFFQNLPLEICKNEIFPYISLSLRCKIINKLSKYLKSSEEAEKYFLFIRANYDNARADFILPKCSPQFILDFVHKSKSIFDHNLGLRVFLNICKRYPEVGVEILSIIFERNKEKPFELSKYKKILLYLAGYHSDLLVPFVKKYHSLIPGKTFGRKLTKKLGRKLKGDLFPDYMKKLIFKENALFSILSAEEQVKFITAISLLHCNNGTPWYSWKSKVSELLKWVPEDKRLEIIDSAFKALNNKNYSENPKFWCSEVLETLPLKNRVPFVEKIEKFVEGDTVECEKNLSSDSFPFESPENYIYLYDSTVAFQRLKEILRKTPLATKRGNILLQLVKTCKINKDPKTLQEVADFVATRHRNDDQFIIFQFLNSIYDLFPISVLNQETFEKVSDLVYFLCLKGPKNESFHNEWKERQIYFCLENNLNVDNLIKSFFESVVLQYRFTYTFISNFKSNHSRVLILSLCNESISWIKNNSSEEFQQTSQSLLLRLLSTCESYNVQNKNKRIYLREIPGLKEILDDKIKEKFPELKGESLPVEICDKYYGDVMNSYYKPKFLFYFLKPKPDLIEKHLEDILKVLLDNNVKFYKSFFVFLKMYFSFFDKTEKVKEIILNEFENNESIYKRKTALEFYSHLCTIEEFSKTVENFIPKGEKVGGGPGKGFDEIQMFVPVAIKNVKPRWKNLEFISKFFFGDFLKTVLPSFYSCCTNTRCDIAVPYLVKRLEEVPMKISYVKDIMRLILEMSDRQGRTKFCLAYWDQHKHYSIRSIVLGYAWRFFLEQPTNELFAVLEKFILDCDETTIQMSPLVSKIPDEFLDSYVQTLWKFSENRKPNFKTNYRKSILLDIREGNIGFLKPEFCESIIRDYLFNPSTGIPVDVFAVLYLAANPKNVESRVLMVLDVVKKRQPDARCFYDFLNTLISKSTDKQSDFADVFTVMLENWPEYPAGVLFEEKVLITYYNLYQKAVKKLGVSDAAVVEFGKELKELFGRVDNLNDLLCIYVSALQNFFGSFGTSNAVLALKELVAGRQNRAVGILAILSLPNTAVHWYKGEGDGMDENVVKRTKDLSEFVDVLGHWGDEIVEIYLRSKFEFVK